MQRRELFEQLKALREGQSEGKEFTVIPLEGMLHKVGVSVEGYPKFFICTNDTASSTKRPPSASATRCSPRVAPSTP